MSFQSAKRATGSSNREAKGFLFLLLILVTPFLLQYGYRYLFYTPQQPDLSTIRLLTDTCETKKYNSQTYADTYKKEPRTHYAGTFPANVKQAVVDINTADSLALEGLPGIGPAFAKRILKYRTLLGGYVQVAQLKEVYGMPEETYEKIKPLCKVSAAAVKHIPGDSLWLLPYKFYHPYLSKELKAAINGRKKSGAYSEGSLKELVTGSDVRLEWYLRY